ncbi:MAG TPA: endo-1,4-beta-xylanase, partial [Polyangiaceae bacterium]|nr:endo-1,4-beta-xylanase [Polyangiaceae bacterium]
LELGTARQAIVAELPAVFTPKTAAAVTGRSVGTAVRSGALAAEPIYAQTLIENFGDVTPENEMKWGVLQPTDRNTWDFTNADAIVAFAASNGLRVKGHTLAWHSQLPPFITPALPPGQINSALTRHINQTVPRYASQLFAWDAVNEAIADDGSGLRDSILSQKLGADWITHSFTLANAKDHDAQLFYNDYGIETVGAKSNAVYDLLAGLLAADVPVDGVGIQGHLDARFAPSVEALVQNFDRFGALGLSVNISELDVQVARVGGNRARRLAVQKQVYQRVAAACVQSAACSGITTWGFTDAHSWIDSTFGADDPLLFDEQYQKKPAYFGYIDGFVGVPLDAPGLEPNLIGNSSFEGGLDGWSVLGSGTLATGTEDAHTGYRSAFVSGRTATWNGPLRDILSLTRSAHTYDVSVWTKLEGAASATTNLTAQVACTGQPTQFIPLAQATASDSGWVELAGELSLPNCALATVAVYVEGPAPEVDISVDDLALREQPLPNLIANGDFESGTSGWFGFGSAVVGVTSDAFSGNQAAIATNRTAEFNGPATNVTSVVQAEGVYQATAFAKLAGATSGPLALTAQVTCQGGPTNFVRVASATGSDSAWSELSGSFTLPNCTLANVTLYVEGPPAGVNVLLDDVSLSQLESSQGPNIIANAGFETGTGGWFPFGAVTISATTARAHSGLQSAFVTNRTATFNGIATSLLGLATPGRTYGVRGFAQVGNIASAGVRFTLQAQCSGAGQTFTTAASATATNGTWVELTGALTVPNCTLTTANLYLEGPAAGIDLYLDDVSVREQL